MGDRRDRRKALKRAAADHGLAAQVRVQPRDLVLVDVGQRGPRGALRVQDVLAQDVLRDELDVARVLLLRAKQQQQQQKISNKRKHALATDRQ